MADVLTEIEARQLCERVLGRSAAEATHVHVSSERTGHTRFAGNGITTAGDTTDTRVTVTSMWGGQRASVVVNDLSDAALGAAVGRSEGLARLAPRDPEWVQPLGPQSYTPNQSFFDSTSGLTAGRRAAAVASVTEPALRSGLVATGFLQCRSTAFAVANSLGLFGYHRTTLASFTTTVRTPDEKGSGWAGTTHNDWDQMTSPPALAAQAIEKAQRSVNAVAVDPAAYTVVLEPTAVGNLVQLLAFELDARAADEGRSFFAKRGGGNRIGETVADERLTLVSDAQDGDLLTQPFTGEGEPAGRTVWIENGVLRNLSRTRYWAKRHGVPPVVSPQGLKLTGGRGSVNDLVRSIDRGLLVSRFWYIRSVERRALRYTGMTRDGTFLIEDGRITQPVKNLRFNESLMTVLNHVDAIGAAVRVVASESGGIGRAVVVPPLVLRDFHFTAVSDAV